MHLLDESEAVLSNPLILTLRIVSLNISQLNTPQTSIDLRYYGWYGRVIQAVELDRPAGLDREL